MSDTHCPHGFYKHEDQCLDTQCLLDEVREIETELRAAKALLRELAVAAMAVPVELGQRLDEYMEAGDE